MPDFIHYSRKIAAPRKPNSAAAILATLKQCHRQIIIKARCFADLHAPRTAHQPFGLRALPNVQTGDWCCFFHKVEGMRD